jgi:putative aldouronate transport system permease protein
MRLSRGEKVFEAINYVVLTILTLIFLIPFLSVIATSLVSAQEIARRGQFILIPYHPTVDAYRELLGSGSIVLNAFAVSLSRVILGTFLDLLFTFPLAYVLARRRLFGRTPITLFVFFTMLFSGGLVPSYLLVEKLHMVDTLWALILPGLINAWWMLIMRNFIMMSIPEELEEAAIVDGASPPLILATIIFPLSLPSIATIGLWYAVGHWNAWFDAVIYLSDPKKLPLQPILRQLLVAGAGIYSEGSEFARGLDLGAPPPGEALRAAMVIIVTVPILLVYPFVQRYFVKGVVLGSVKG